MAEDTAPKTDEQFRTALLGTLKGITLLLFLLLVVAALSYFKLQDIAADF